MAGRHHVPPHSLGRREREAQLREREAHFRERGVPLSRSSQPHHPVLIEDPRRPLPGNHLPFAASDSRQHPALIGERIDAQHREIQALLLDNQRLAATHVALKQELAAAQQELRHLSAAAVEVKAETDAQVREVYEQSLKMEAEVRSIDALKGELNQVKADIQKLDASRQELVADLKTIDGDLTLAHSELQHLPAIEKEIENMHRELKKGRAAIEYEKKTHAHNLELRQAMEKHMMAMAKEIETLRAELDDAEKRARAAAAAAAANPSPGFATSYGNADMGYGQSIYSEPYGIHQIQVPGSASAQYGSAAAASAPYNMQQGNVHR